MTDPGAGRGSVELPLRPRCGPPASPSDGAEAMTEASAQG